MDKLSILSPLILEDWLLSWKDKVVDAEEKRTNIHIRSDYFCGKIKKNNECELEYYKAFSSKTLSVDEHFYGQIEETETGTKITGYFSKKKSIKLYLVIGTILSLCVLITAIMKGQSELVMTSAGLLLIFFAMYKLNPKKDREILKEQLIKISSDESYVGRAEQLRQEKAALAIPDEDDEEYEYTYDDEDDEEYDEECEEEESDESCEEAKTEE